jgi:hypothetical protein
LYKNDFSRLSPAQTSIQKQLVDRENELTKKVSQITNSIKDTVDIRSISKLELNTQFDSKGFSFYIFTDTVLSYWSTNRVPIGSVFDSSLYTKPIVLLSNGWYQPVFIQKGKLVVLGLALVKYNYLYENTYLENSFAPDYHIDNDIQLNPTLGSYNIYNSQKRFLFTLFRDEDKTNTDVVAIQVIFLFSIALGLFLFAIYSILKQLLSTKNKLSALIMLLLAVVLVGIRFVMFFYKIPDILYQSKLFSPIYYASSVWLPSLGDLLLHTIFMVLFILLIKKSVSIYFPKFKIYNWIKIIIGSFFLLIQFFSYRILVLLIKSIVLNSSISFNNDSIFNYTYLNYLVFIHSSCLKLCAFI